MKRRAWVMAVAVCAVVGASQVAQAQRTDAVVRESYEAAIGRRAQDAEVKYWMTRNDWKSKQDLVNLHLQSMKINDGVRTDAVNAAFAKCSIPNPSQPVRDYWKQQVLANPRTHSTLTNDVAQWLIQRTAYVVGSYDIAIGRNPTKDEIVYWVGRLDYNSKQDLVNLHRQGIKTNQGLADEVIVNSYKKVFGYVPRPGGGEITHWRQHAKLGWTCQEMTVEHEKWKRNNLQPAKSDVKITKALDARGMVLDTIGNIVPKNQVTQILFAAGTWLYQNQQGVTAIVQGATKVVSSK